MVNICGVVCNTAKFEGMLWGEVAKDGTDATGTVQAKGCTPEAAARLLQKVTENGNVPEALRIAHLIGSAVKTGQSGKRA